MSRKTAAIAILVIPLAMSGAERAIAQPAIAPDNTLGNERSRVLENVTLNGQPLTTTINGTERPIDTIVNGARRGNNVFHSFTEFNARADRGTYFVSPDSQVQNILARVTGRNPSEILGRLGVFQVVNGNITRSNTNLFLINPNGILFGQNASLDVGGSFVATTANAVRFGNDSFSATNPQAVSNVLSVDPSAFLFNQIPVSKITISSNAPISPGSSFSGLRVPNGKNLILLGGNVNVEGGQLNAFGGRVEIGAVGGKGTIGLNSNGSLNIPDGIERLDVFFDQNAKVDVASSNQGDIGITARNISISESKLFAGIYFGLGAESSQAGNLTLNATDEVRIGNASQISNDVSQKSIGDGGNVKITTGSLLVTGATQVGANTFGKGNAGNVTIEVRDHAVVSNSSNVLNNVEQGAEGHGGNVIVSANLLELFNNSQIGASTRSKGNAGNVTIEVRDRVALNDSGILSNVEQGAEGNGGNVRVFANSLELLNGSNIAAAVRGGRGNGGNITIEVKGSAVFIGTNSDQLRSSGGGTLVQRGAEGNAGNIKLSANSLELRDGAQISSATKGKGNAGTIEIKIRDNIVFNGTSQDGRFSSGIFSDVFQEAEGNGGNIKLSANSLELFNRAQIASGTSGKGNAGNITVEVRDGILLNNRAAVFSNVAQGGEGKSGNIVISTSSLELINGSQLIASTQGKGDAGDIFLGQANNPIASILISGISTVNLSSALFTSTRSDYSGGNISIFANQFRLSDGAVVDARTYATGNSGTVSIDADALEITQGGQILAITQGNGSANRITINVRDRLLITGIDSGYEQRRQDFPTAVSPISSESGIFTRSLSSGSAGDIFITGSEIRLNDQARIDAQSATVDGGNINIRASDRLLLRNNSQISASAGTAEAGGNGGNIDINARFLIAIPQENSDISANAFQGSGGRVTISTQGGILGLESRPRSTPSSDITASSEVGISGTITLNTTDTNNLQNSLTQLPQTAIDTNTLLANSCIARNPQNGSFYITGTGGLPTNPGDISTYSTGTIQPTNSSSAWNPGDPIVEPQRVYQLPNGELVLSRDCP